MTGRQMQTAVLMMLMLALVGCGIRPRPPAPGLNAERAIELLRAHEGAVNDFSARARTTVSDGGAPQNATLVVRYLAPDRGRVYIKGFAGIDMARVSLLADSVVVYVPPENYWFGIPRTGGLLKALIPEIDLGVGLLTTMFDTAIPEKADENAVMEQTDDGPVLVIREGAITRRLALAGDPLVVTAEERYRDGVLEWRREMDGYRDIDGVMFPTRLTVTDGVRSAEFAFSDITLNSGLTEANLRFTIPSSAEQVHVTP